MDQQRSAAVIFEKSNDGSIHELSEKLQNAMSTNEKLEENVKGLEKKLSIAEEEKLQLRKVCVMLKVEFLQIMGYIHNLHHTSCFEGVMQSMANNLPKNLVMILVLL